MEWNKIKLTQKQLADIEDAEEHTNKTQLLKRLQCIKLKHEGWKHDKIAKFLRICIDTVTDWLKAYKQGGIEALLQWNYEGRVSVLTLSQQNILIDRNNKKPFNDAKEAKNFIEDNFGVKFHLHWVQKLLKKNFNFHSRK